MKTLLAVLIVCFTLSGFSAWPQMKEGTHPGVHSQMHSGQQECHHCGMDREKFAHSAMLIEYEDGTVSPTCSLHCTAVDLAINIDKSPRAIKVNDYNTKKQIEAETACWTVGGDVQGVMTKRAKWAFENKADCEKFAKEHGAQLVTFEDAVKASYEDMYSDTKMIQEKRKMRRLQQQKLPEVKK